MRRSNDFSNGGHTKPFLNRVNSGTEKTRNRDPLECLLQPTRRSRHRLSHESSSRRWYDSSSVDDARSTPGYVANSPTAQLADRATWAPALKSTITNLDNMRRVGTDPIHRRLSDGGIAFGKTAPLDTGNNDVRQWTPRIGERKRGDFRTLRRSGQNDYTDGVKTQSGTDTAKHIGHCRGNSPERHVEEPIKHYERAEKADASRSPYRGFPKKSAVECPSWSAPSDEAISKHERLRYFDQIISDFNSRSSTCSQYDSSSQRGFLAAATGSKGDGRPLSSNSHLDCLCSTRIGPRTTSPEQDYSVSMRRNLGTESPRSHMSGALSRIDNHTGSALRNIPEASPLVSPSIPTEMSPGRGFHPTSPRRDTRHIAANLERPPSPPRRYLDGNVLMDVRLPQANIANKSMDKERYTSLHYQNIIISRAFGTYKVNF